MKKTTGILALAGVLAGSALAFAAGVWHAAPDPSPNPVWTMNQAYQSFAYTPVDGQKFPATKALFVAGTSGNAACVLVMKLKGDTATATWTNVAAGAFLPVEAVDIEASSTTCVGIILLY